MHTAERPCIPVGSRYHTLGTFDAMATPKMATKLLHHTVHITLCRSDGS